MNSSRRRIECPDCGADNAPTSKFCDACGVSLALEGTTTAEPEAAATSQKEGKLERTEKIAIQRKLSSARKVLKGVRTLYSILAVVSLFVTLALGADLMHAQSSVSSLKTLAFAVSLGSCLLLVGGVLFLYLQPLFWTSLIAAVYSVEILLVVLNDGFPSMISILIVLFLWAAVGTMLNISRLQKEYPDFLTNDKLKSRKRREGVDVSEARLRAEERVRIRRQAQLRSFAVVGGIFVVVIIAVIAPWGGQGASANQGSEAAAKVQEPALPAAEKSKLERELTAQLLSFRNAYGDVDLDAMKAMFIPEKRESYFPKIARVIEKRGWTKSLPTLREENHYGDAADRQRVYFELPKGKLKTRWIHIDEGWRIDTLTFSRTR